MEFGDWTGTRRGGLAGGLVQDITDIEAVETWEIVDEGDERTDRYGTVVEGQPREGVLKRGEYPHLLSKGNAHGG